MLQEGRGKWPKNSGKCVGRDDGGLGSMRKEGRRGSLREEGRWETMKVGGDGDQ